MPVSEDFKRSMSLLHQQMQALVKDNEEMRKELNDLRRLVVRGDDVNVKKKDDLIKRAVLSGNQDKIDAMQTGANTVVQDELLRHASLQDIELSHYQPQPNPELLSALIAAKQTGEAMPGAQIVLNQERQPTHAEVLAAKLTLSSQALAASERARLKAEHSARIRAMQPKPGTNALKGLSPRWAGPMDGQEDF